MQQPAAWFAISNVSRGACSLLGYPAFTLLDRSSRAISMGPIERGGGYLINDPGAHLVRLEPGGLAFFGFNWVDANMADGGSSQGCQEAWFARVLLPGDNVASPVHARLREVVCPNAEASPPSNGQSLTAINTARSWAGAAVQPPRNPDRST